MRARERSSTPGGWSWCKVGVNDELFREVIEIVGHSPLQWRGVRGKGFPENKQFWWSSFWLVPSPQHLLYTYIHLNVKNTECPIWLSSTTTRTIHRKTRIKTIASGCEDKTHTYTILSSLFTQCKQRCIVLHWVLFQVLSLILRSSGTLRPSVSGLERSVVRWETAHSGRAHWVICSDS